LKIEGTERVYEIEKITMHELYGQHGVGHDIALVKLSSDVRYSAAIGSVCLPDDSLPEWANSVAIGWGDTQGRQLKTYI